jgi:hypothetical protein
METLVEMEIQVLTVLMEIQLLEDLVLQQILEINSQYQ